MSGLKISNLIEKLKKFFIEKSYIFIILFILLGFGFIGGCLFYMNWEQDKYLKKYCFQAKNEGNCANKEILFLTVR